MAQSKNTTASKAITIAAQMRKMRRTLDYSGTVEEITGQFYSQGKAQAILINLTKRSLSQQDDRIIALAMWKLIKPYTEIDGVMVRREKLMGDIKFSKAKNTLQDKEDSIFRKIAEKCTEYKPEELASIVNEGLATFYDEDVGKPIFPQLLLSFDEPDESTAASESDTGNEVIDEEYEQEETEVNPVAVPANTSANIETENTHEQMPGTNNAESNSALVGLDPDNYWTEEADKNNTLPTPTAINTPLNDNLKSKNIHLGIIIGLVTILVIFAIALTNLEPRVFEDALKIDYTVDLQVRNQGITAWYDSLSTGQVGDIVELQFEFLDRRSASSSLAAEASEKLGLISGTNDVIVVFYLSENLKYISGTATLYNSDYPDGLQLNDSIVTPYGANLGSYYLLGNSYVQISCVITNDDLQPGKNQILSAAHATVSGVYDEDNCLIYVTY